ncbi:MAG: hypothetical protein WBG43_09880 [Marinifilaceae bacterium]
MQDDVHIADTIALICLKAQALIDYSNRAAAGESNCSKQINKHKADMLRLTLLLTPDDAIIIPDSIKEKLSECLTIMTKEPPSKDIFKNMGLSISPIEVIKQFKEFFNV